MIASEVKKQKVIERGNHYERSIKENEKERLAGITYGACGCSSSRGESIRFDSKCQRI